MNGLAGLGTLTPETSCNGSRRIGGNRGYCNTVNPSHLSDKYAARQGTAISVPYSKVLKVQYLKKIDAQRR
jgi:hypothetical protein